jgi:perosamine synthetase
MIHLDDSALFKNSISTNSPDVEKFEQAMAEYLGVNDTVAVNSGTAALHLALLASGVGPGDKVIMPTLTFCGTANAVEMCGADPVFADVCLRRWNMTISDIIDHIHRDDIDVVIGVDLYGNPCDPHVGYYHLLVSDSAESLGSIDFNESDYTCYSFNGNKILSTGSGGLITGKDLTRIRRLANQGRNEIGECMEPGFNYRMNGTQAKLGLRQLPKLPYRVRKKRRINEIYRNELPTLTFQEATEGTRPNWWFTAAMFPEHIDIEMLQIELGYQDIPTRRIFKPLHLQAAYKETGCFPNAEMIWDRGLCLPSSVMNTEKDTMCVCEAIKGLI